jgi:hypothetical protein
MAMIKLSQITAFAAVLAFILVPAGAAAAPGLDDVPSFRCAGETISIGDRQYSVIEACGVPDKITVSAGGTVETWVYNFGPTEFIHYVTFVRGRLSRIQAGEYGSVELEE